MERNTKEICVKCGFKDLPTRSKKCRICDPTTFYNESLLTYAIGVVRTNGI